MCKLQIIIEANRKFYSKETYKSILFIKVNILSDIFNPLNRSHSTP